MVLFLILVFDVLNENFKKMIETMKDRDQDISKMLDLEKEIIMVIKIYKIKSNNEYTKCFILTLMHKLIHVTEYGIYFHVINNLEL